MQSQHPQFEALGFDFNTQHTNIAQPLFRRLLLSLLARFRRETTCVFFRFPACRTRIFILLPSTLKLNSIKLYCRFSPESTLDASELIENCDFHFQRWKKGYTTVGRTKYWNNEHRTEIMVLFSNKYIHSLSNRNYHAVTDILSRERIATGTLLRRFK